MFAIPKPYIDIGMDPMNHYRHDQFAIYFTAQPVFLACIGLMNAQNRFNLFKQKLNLYKKVLPFLEEATFRTHW